MMDKNPSVRDRLAKIEASQAVAMAERALMKKAIEDRAVETSSAVRELTLEVRKHFEGDGTSPGLFTRLDRLEQTEFRRARSYWVALTASLGALALALSQKLFGGGH